MVFLYIGIVVFCVVICILGYRIVKLRRKTRFFLCEYCEKTLVWEQMLCVSNPVHPFNLCKNCYKKVYNAMKKSIDAKKSRRLNPKRVCKIKTKESIMGSYFKFVGECKGTVYTIWDTNRPNPFMTDDWEKTNCPRCSELRPKIL